MYLQITTKCNMRCIHCAFSCSPNKGEYMQWSTFIDAISFAKETEEIISIGGGEPTIHPRFFDILRHALWTFDYVWFATNGKKTNTMKRLIRIVEEYDCNEEYNPIILAHENHLCVALSQDYYHEDINPMIANYWKKRSRDRRSGYEIRDVTTSFTGITAQGRAKRNNLTDTNHCICPGIFINPQGGVKMCGCENSPIIGTIWSGIEDKWQEFMNTQEYNNTQCFNEARKDRLQLEIGLH